MCSSDLDINELLTPSWLSSFISQSAEDGSTTQSDDVFEHQGDGDLTTTLNRQGPDRGEQYRSVIFYHSPTQLELAQKSKAQLASSGTYPKPIVTEISSANDYWLATEDHQQYFLKKKSAGKSVLKKGG